MDELEAASFCGNDLREVIRETGPANMHSADLAGGEIDLSDVGGNRAGASAGIAGVGVKGMGTSAGIGGTASAKAMSADVSSGLGLILDIPVTMSLEVGSTKITINELLTMGDGAVIELNRSAGDPLDVKVNGKLIGRGEVVETNGRYGIRLTEIVSQNERLGQVT